MCTILSHGKCSCFLFLVILAVFSSGFPIDNVAMTDFSKRNSRSHTSLVNSHELTPPHRIRHQRTPPPSSPHKRRKPCPELDVSFKAYKADAVAIAKVESQSSNCKENCTVQFRVLEWLKNPPPYQGDRRFRLYFRNDKKNYCEYDDVTNRSHFLVRTKISPSKEYILFLRTNVPHDYSSYFVPEINRKRTLGVVKKVLNPNFNHGESVTILKVAVECYIELQRLWYRSLKKDGENYHDGKGPEPKPVRIEKFDEKREKTDRGTIRKKLRLQCKVHGYPFPVIHWRRNNTVLHPNSRIRITHKNLASDGSERKKSTLVIRNFNKTDWGEYQCETQGVDGNPVRKTLSIGRPADGDKKPCDEPHKTGYCFNGGTCYHLVIINEYMCECPPGYIGHRCEVKKADRSSERAETKS